MNNFFQTVIQLLYRHLKVIWILLTIALLLIGFYINLNLNTTKAHKAISNVAVNLSNKLDGFIEDLFQEIYTLPVYGKNMTDCENSITPYLQHIVINNPKISGLMVIDSRNQLICSTLPNNEAYFSGTSQTRTILGPFKLSMFETPVYIIQQKIGTYLIGIIVVSSTLENALKFSDKIIDSVVLYDNSEKKNIVQVARSSNGQKWEIIQDTDSSPPNKFSSSNRLQSINGIMIVVYENDKTTLNNLWISEGLLSVAILFMSYFFYSLVRNLMTRHYSLHNAMKMAIKNKRFYPVYQPIYGRIKKTFTGVEVLLRWHDNQDEIIMPDFFIEEAETNGLIIPITLQIVEIAFQEINSFLATHPEFHLAFNLSAQHFTDTSFFSKFYQLVTQYNIPPNQILLEITERDLLDKNDSIFVNKMQELIEMGYSLAVDDYGTGHASISYLQNFPFNYLKIDQLFVHAIGTKAITESLIDTIISMAKRLNLIIIAEGVETKEQFNYLSENGVQFLQGWYFSKALPLEQLMELLKGKANERVH